MTQSLSFAARYWRLAMPASLVLLALAWLSAFPVVPALLGLLYACAMAWVWRRPMALFALVPAAMPLLDLSPWSGQRSIDEFDVLLALTCAVAWTRLPGSHARASNGGTLVLALGVSLVLTLGMSRGLWPSAGMSTEGFEYPLNPLNALRVGKGAGWALVLFVLARRWQAAGEDVLGAFASGMVLGLAGTVLWVFAERLTFSGIADFEGDYRVSGPFAAMSLGGAYIECWLVVATPFLLSKLMPPTSLLRQAVGAVFLAGTAYSLAVTFSRGGYAAMVIAMVVFVLATVWLPGRRPRTVAVSATLVALVCAVAYPVLVGSFAQSRIKAVTTDLGIRERHWSESLDAMGSDPLTHLVGLGLGRYAAVSFWHLPPERRPGGHQLLVDGQGEMHLRLGAGSSYYVEQIVSVRRESRYRLQAEVRHSDASASPGWSLCQKWLVASFDCGQASGPLSVGASSRDGWRSVAQSIVTPPAGPGPMPRPVRLSLRNPGSTPFDIARVSLMDESGTDIVLNGSFKAGMDRWTVTSDEHLAWHTKSLPLGLYFELGAIGAAAFALLFLSGIWRAAMAVSAGQAAAAAPLAALCAFLAVGLFDTLIDEPRFLMLWILLCLLPQLIAKASTPSISLR